MPFGGGVAIFWVSGEVVFSQKKCQSPWLLWPWKPMTGQPTPSRMCSWAMMIFSPGKKNKKQRHLSIRPSQDVWEIFQIFQPLSHLRLFFPKKQGTKQNMGWVTSWNLGGRSNESWLPPRPVFFLGVVFRISTYLFLLRPFYMSKKLRLENIDSSGFWT